jgi:MFS family permease
MTSPKTATQPNPAADYASSIRISRQRRNCIFLAIALAMLVAALGQTSVATALPTIVADLGNPKHQSWVVTPYLLGATAVTALVGKLR